MKIDELIQGLKGIRETCIKRGVECAGCDYENLCDVVFNGSAPAGWRLQNLEGKDENL